MLRLTRGALTMLLAEYRSVLKNAYLKNAVAAAVAVSAAVVAPAAYADDSSETIKTEGKDTDTKLCSDNDETKCTLENATVKDNTSLSGTKYGKDITLSGTNTLDGVSLNAVDTSNITVSGGATTMKGTSSLKAGSTVSVSKGATLINNDTATLQGETVSVDGTLTNNKTLTVKDATGTSNNALSVSGTLNNNGTLNVKSANLKGVTNLGDSSAINADETITATTVNVKGTGAVLKGATVSVSSVKVEEAKELTVKGTSFNTNGGTVSNSGTLTIASTTDAIIQNTVNNTGKLNLNSTTTTLSGKLTNTGTIEAGAINTTGTIENSGSITAGAVTINGGTINNTGKKINENTTQPAILTVDSLNALKGSLNLKGYSSLSSSGKVTVEGASVTTSGTGNGISANNIELNKGGSITVSSGDLNLAGGTSGAIKVDGGTLSNAGTLKVENTNNFAFTSGVLKNNGTMNLEATNTTLSSSFTNDGTLNLGDKDSTVSVTAGTITNNKTINVNAGTTKITGGTIDNKSALNLGTEANTSEKVTVSGGTINNKAGATVKVNAITEVNSGAVTNAGDMLVYEDLKFGDNTLTNTGNITVNKGTTTFGALKDSTLGGKLNVAQDGTASFTKDTTVTDIVVDGTLDVAGGSLSVAEGGNFVMNGSTTIGSGTTLDLTTLESATFGETAFNGTNVKNNGTIKALKLNLTDSNDNGTTTLVNTGTVKATQLVASKANEKLDISGTSNITVGPILELDENGEEYGDPTNSLSNFTDVTVKGSSSLTINQGTVDLKTITLNPANDDGSDYGTMTIAGNRSYQWGTGKLSHNFVNKVDDLTINAGTIEKGEGLQLSNSELAADKVTINAENGITLNNSVLKVDLDNVTVGDSLKNTIVSTEAALQYYNDQSIIVVTGANKTITVSDSDVDGSGYNDLGDIYEKLGIGESAANNSNNRQTINDDSRALLDIRDADGNAVTFEYSHRNQTANGTTAIDIKDILDHKSTNDVSNVATAAAQTNAFTGDRINDITANETIDQKLRVGSLNAQSDSTQIRIDANVKLFTATTNNARNEAEGVNAESKVFVSRTRSEDDQLDVAHVIHNASDPTHKLDEASNQNADAAHNDDKNGPTHTTDSVAEAEKLLGVKLADDAWLGLYNGGAIGFVEAENASSGTLYITGGRTMIKTDDRATATDETKKSGIGTASNRVKQVTIDKTTAVVEDYNVQNSDTNVDPTTKVRENLRDSYATNFTINSLAGNTGKFVVRTFDTKENTSLSGILDVENTLQSGTLTSSGIYNDSKHKQFRESSQLIVKNNANITDAASLTDTNTVVKDVNGNYRSFTAGSLKVEGTQSGTHGENTDGKTHSTIDAGEITTTNGNIEITNSIAKAYGGKDADGKDTLGNISSAKDLITNNSNVDAEESITSKANMSHTGSLVTADQDITSGGTFLSDNSIITAENGDITSADDMTIQNGSKVTAEGKIDSEGALTSTDSTVKTLTGDITAANKITISNSTVSANDGKNDLISENAAIEVLKKSTVTAKDVQAKTDVTVNDSKVTATNAVTATSGSFTAKNGADVSAINVTAGKDVIVDASTVKTTEDIKASGGAFSATNGSTVSGKNITAKTTVKIDSSKITATGDLVSEGAGDSKTDSMSISGGSSVTVKGTTSSAGNLTVTDSTLDTDKAVVKGNLTTAKTDGSTATTYIKTSSKTEGIAVDGKVTVGAGTTVATEKLTNTDGGALKGDVTVGGLLDVEEDLTIGNVKTTVLEGGTLDGHGKITSSGDVSIAGTATSKGDFTTGNLTVASTGTMTSTAGNIKIDGTTETSGKINATAGTLTASGLFTMNDSASTTVKGNATFDGGLTLTNKDNYLHVTEGDLTVNNKQFVMQNGATVNVDKGNASFTAGADIEGNLNIAKTITVDGDTLTVREGSNIKGNEIDLKKGGTVEAGSTITANTTIKSDATLTVKDGTADKSTVITAKEIDVTKGDLDIGDNNKVTASSGIKVDTGNMTVGESSSVTTSKVTVSEGNVTVENGADVTATDVTVSKGNMTVKEGSTVTTKTITVETGTLDVGKGSTVTASGNVHAEKGGTVQGELKVSGKITSVDDFKVENGGDVTAAIGEYDKNLFIYGVSDFTNNLTMDGTKAIDIYVGYQGESGILTANRMYLNGRSLYIDPDFSKSSSIVGAVGFGGYTDDYVTTTDGKLLLGQNSILAVGMNDSDAIINAVTAISDTELVTTTNADGSTTTTDNTFFNVAGATVKNQFKENSSVQNLLYLSKALNIADGYAFYSKNENFNTGKNTSHTVSAGVDANTITWGDYTGIVVTQNTANYVNGDRVNRGAVNLLATSSSTDLADGGSVSVAGSNSHVLYLSGNLSKEDVSRFPVFNSGYYTKSITVTDDKIGLVTTDGSTSASGTLKVNTSTTTDTDGNVKYTEDSYIKKVDSVTVKMVNNTYYDWSGVKVYLLLDGTLSVDGDVSFNSGAVDLFTDLSTPGKTYVGNALQKYSAGDGLGADYIYDRAADSLGKDIEATSRLALFGGAYHTAQAIMGMGSDAALGSVGFGGIAPDAYIGEDYALWAVANYNDIKIDSHSAQGVNYGVDIDLMGLTIGSDHLFEDGSRMGVFMSVGMGTSKGKQIGSTVSNDFDYYGFGFYGKKTVTENFDVLGDLYMMRLNSDLSQSVPDENYGTLEGDADMTVVSGSLYGKYTFHNDNKIDVAPYAGIILSRYDLDNYNVNCAKGKIAEVSDDVQNVISFPVGVTISGEYLAEDDWTVKPIFDVRLTANAGNRDVSSNVTFTGVEGSETLKTQVLDDITYGGVLKFEATSGQTTIGFGLNYTGSKNMDNYGVIANVRHQF